MTSDSPLPPKEAIYRYKLQAGLLDKWILCYAVPANLGPVKKQDFFCNNYDELIFFTGGILGWGLDT